MCVATTSNGGIDVAPESRERVDPILENYLLALAGVDQCSANAPDTVRSRLAVNLERAELCALERGNGQSRRRLHGGAPITDLLVELEQGTDRANRIVRAAILRQEAR
jgi:hypothetical protein